jgi:hypothetical protein
MRHKTLTPKPLDGGTASLSASITEGIAHSDAYWKKKLSTGSYKGRMDAVREAVRQNDATAVPHIANFLLRLIRTEEDLQWDVMNELVKMNDHALPHLVAMLNDRNIEVRGVAASGIGDLAKNGVDCSSAVPAMIGIMLKHLDQAVTDRTERKLELAVGVAQPDLPDLIDVLCPVPFELGVIVRAFSSLKDERAIEPLKRVFAFTGMTVFASKKDPFIAELKEDATKALIHQGCSEAEICCAKVTVVSSQPELC